MAAWETLVDAATLRNALAGSTPPVVFDCRFVLTDPDGGEAAYRDGHLPGAHYAHLDRDLSGPAGDGGRHPLPAADAVLHWAEAHGVSADTQVVCYDDGIGAFAARLWWLLRWLGHRAVAVLDGGVSAWLSSGGVLVDTPTAPALPGHLTQRASGFQTRSVVEVEAISAEGSACLIDARDRQRYLGEHEPFAPVAGHIPLARSRPFPSNCDTEGRFHPPERLRAEFAAYGEGECVCYCGSGVTACHNILAAVHAGLDPPRLYVGSWSQWVLDPDRPVATGAG
ncbi:MAG: sulfurtransferase [Pseudomonadota bacterium]